MAAQKRKSAANEPPAKRQRLDTTGKAGALIKKKTASPEKPVGYKSKLNKGPNQIKKLQKVCVTQTGPVNKALKKSTQTKGTLNRSKKITPELKQKHKPEFKQKPSRGKPVGKVQAKKTVAKSNNVLSSKTVARTSLGIQNIVSKPLRNNLTRVAQKETTLCKTIIGSGTRKTPSRLGAAVNGRKCSPNASSVKSPGPSVRKSVKLKTALKRTHLEKEFVTNDSGRNRTARGSSRTAKNLHELNAKKPSKRFERGALSNDATIAVKKHTRENPSESRTAMRKNVRSAVDRKAHRDIKSHSNPKSANQRTLAKEAAKYGPKSKQVSSLKPKGRRSQQPQQPSDMTVQSRQKEDVKKKVSRVNRSALVTKNGFHRVKTGKHTVVKKQSQQKGPMSASRHGVRPMDKKLKDSAQATRKPKEVQQVLKSHPQKVSTVKHKLGVVRSCPKTLPKSEVSAQQSLHGDTTDTSQQPAPPGSCPKKKGKGPVSKEKVVLKAKKLKEKVVLKKKKLKEKVSLKEKRLKEKAVLKEKKLKEKAVLKEKKLKEKAVLKEKKLKEKAVLKETKLKEKAALKEKKLEKMVSRKVVRRKVKSKPSEAQASVIETTGQLENDPASKRVTILELCEEIAGEIESDTVEVRKELPEAACATEATKAAEEQRQQVETESQKLAEEEASQNSPSKCFFPSKKTMLAKNRLNGKTSPIIGKTSPIISAKRKAMKLIQANHATRNNALNRAALPNLESLRRNILVPSKGMQARTKEVDPVPRDLGCLEIQGRLLGTQLEEANPVHNSGKPEEVCLEGVVAKVPTMSGQLPGSTLVTGPVPNLGRQAEMRLGEFRSGEVPQDKGRPKKRTAENGPLKDKLELEPALDENFTLRLDSSPESSPKKTRAGPSPPKQTKLDIGDWELEGPTPVQPVLHLFTDQAPENGEKRLPLPSNLAANSTVPLSDANLQKEIRKLKEADKDGDNQLIIDAGQKRFGAVSCNVCGMLYTASNPEDETQHILFHNQFISAVKYVGWKKERTVEEFPDGKIIMVFPDDPKYALRKVEEIREMVDNDLGFQQVPLKFHARTKTLLFISNDKKVVGCLIAEHIQQGYRVIDEKMIFNNSERDKAVFESQKAWCCSTSPEPALCGISRIWVFRMMRRQKIASRMIECLRSNFIYGSYLSKEEIAFSDPTPDGKLFATQYCGTGQFLVYNFINGQPKTT